MLITDNFVMLNFPKTGSAFARDAIKRLHRSTGLRAALERRGLMRSSLQELLMKPYFFTATQGVTIPTNSEHGVYSQVPAAHQAKPVITVMRDPEKRMVSAYEFRSWAKHPIPNAEQVVEWFPSFPDISFEQFIRMNQELILPYIQPNGMQVKVGPLTTKFIRMYARDPRKTMLALRENTDLRKDYDQHFPKIHFLHTENLNQELYDLLLQFGYPSNKIAFILEKQKMNTTGRSRNTYLTPELTSRLQHSERFFYQLFPEYLNKPE